METYRYAERTRSIHNPCIMCKVEVCMDIMPNSPANRRNPKFPVYSYRDARDGEPHYCEGESAKYLIDSIEYLIPQIELQQKVSKYQKPGA